MRKTKRRKQKKIDFKKTKPLISKVIESHHLVNTENITLEFYMC